jgi:hypothetical protein
MLLRAHDECAAHYVDSFELERARVTASGAYFDQHSARRRSCRVARYLLCHGTVARAAEPREYVVTKLQVNRAYALIGSEITQHIHGNTWLGCVSSLSTW